MISQNGYRPILNAQASSALPAALPDPPHRGINDDPTREVVYSPFSISSNGLLEVWGGEASVLSLQHPHSAVDVFVNLESIVSPTLGTLVNYPNAAFFELACAIYSTTGGIRVPVARGAYAPPWLAAAPTATPFRPLWVGSSRSGGERFDVTLRAMFNSSGVVVAENTLIKGTVSAIGYDSPPSEQRAVQVRQTQGPAKNGGVGRNAQLFKFTAINETATTTFLQFFDRLTAVGGGDFPIETFEVPANAQTIFSYADVPLEFLNSVIWASSSTARTFTAAGAQNLTVTLQYA